MDATSAEGFWPLTAKLLDVYHRKYIEESRILEELTTENCSDTELGLCGIALERGTPGRPEMEKWA